MDNRLTDNEIKRHNKEYGFCNLLGNCLVYSKTLEDYNDMRKGLKSAAYKEFAESLKERFCPDTRYSEAVNSAAEIFRDAIDNILAELTDNTFTKVDHNSLCETETYEG